MEGSTSEPRLIRFKEIGSTNVALKQLNDEKSLPEFSVVSAIKQSSGRGQQENTWESEEGKNLTFSFIIRPWFLNARDQFRITQVVALALIDLLKPLVGDVSIKWPNDIYAGDNKLAGILIENSLTGSNIEYSIIGIGLNVNQERFFSDAPNPVSLINLTGLSHDLDKMLTSYMACFMERYTSWLELGDTELETCYINNLYRSKGIFRYRDHGGEFDASFLSVEPDGHLLLKLSNGEVRRYAFKEVTFGLP